MGDEIWRTFGLIVNDLSLGRRILRRQAPIAIKLAGDAQAFLGHTDSKTTRICLRGKRVKEVQPNPRKFG